MVVAISSLEELQAQFGDDKNKGKLIVLDFFAT